ncbi:MAG: prepilin-type N-terminal cleavage/methylation domain-containing protein [Bdellovibrionales bacterium]|nr:prepilin-type N-terminal cleavage/methylation domain-containing protein [Bdellovibrionales bacterium]
MTQECQYKDGYQMRKMRCVNPNQSGFTLIEILMAVVLVGILATIAVTQFTDFSKEAKNSAVRQSLAVLRAGIQKQYGNMRVRCNLSAAEASEYPDVAQIIANDITAAKADASASVCTTTEIAQVADRYFVAGGVPENPWSSGACTAAERRGVLVYTGTTAHMATGTDVGTLVDTATPTTGCGWIYEATTGRIKANSKNNGGGANETESSY